MRKQPDGVTLPLLPAAAFVLVWCSGYIAGPAGVEALDPFSLLVARFVVAAGVLAVIARVLRGPLQIRRPALGRVVAVGLIMNGLMFGLMYIAFDLGMDPTLAALLHSLSPVLTAVLAGLFLHERITRLQVLGFVLGVVGVVLVLGPDIDQAGGPLAITLGLLSLIALSVGTLGQRWYQTDRSGEARVGHDAVDPLWAATIQFAACIPLFLVLEVATVGTPQIHDPRMAVITVLWIALVNSIAGLLLLAELARRGGAGAAASLFFACPPVTAVMAWIAFGNTINLRELVGILIAVLGVAIATGVFARLRGRLPEGDIEEVLEPPA